MTMTLTAASAASTAGPTSRRYSSASRRQTLDPRREQRQRPGRVGHEAHQQGQADELDAHGRVRSRAP